MLFLDDFEGYSLGTSFPFGSWQAFSGSVSGGIVAGGYGQAFQIDSGIAEWADVTSYRTSFTIYHFFKTAVGDNQLIELTHGPNAFGSFFGILLIRLEKDGTLSAIISTTNELIGNSRDHVLSFTTQNLLQINITVSDWDNLGVMQLQISCDIALNGTTIISHTLQSSLPVALFVHATAEINRFAVIGSRSQVIDLFAIDSHTSIPAFPIVGSPAARVSSGIIETLNLPDSANILIKSGINEIVKLPDSAKIHVSSGIIELLLLKTVSQGLWKVREM